MRESAVRDGGLRPAGASGGHDTHQPHAMAPGLMGQTIGQARGHPQNDATRPGSPPSPDSPAVDTSRGLLVEASGRDSGPCWPARPDPRTCASDASDLTGRSAVASRVPPIPTSSRSSPVTCTSGLSTASAVTRRPRPFSPSRAAQCRRGERLEGIPGRRLAKADATSRAGTCERRGWGEGMPRQRSCWSQWRILRVAVDLGPTPAGALMMTPRVAPPCEQASGTGGHHTRMTVYPGASSDVSGAEWRHWSTWYTSFLASVAACWRTRAAGPCGVRDAGPWRREPCDLSR
jgi:hypothetical protein